jgi:hypothetical protein
VGDKSQPCENHPDLHALDVLSLHGLGDQLRVPVEQRVHDVGAEVVAEHGFLDGPDGHGHRPAVLLGVAAATQVDLVRLHVVQPERALPPHLLLHLTYRRRVERHVVRVHLLLFDQPLRHKRRERLGEELPEEGRPPVDVAFGLPAKHGEDHPAAGDDLGRARPEEHAEVSPELPQVGQRHGRGAGARDVHLPLVHRPVVRLVEEPRRDLGEPVQAGAGADEVHARPGEQPPVERARDPGQEHHRPAPLVRPGRGLEPVGELRQAEEDGVEVVGGQVVEQHRELGRRPRRPAARPADAPHDVLRQAQRVGPRGAAEVGHREPLRHLRDVHVRRGAGDEAPQRVHASLLQQERTYTRWSRLLRLRSC